VPCSVVFAACGGRAVVLALTQQLIGESAFGADGYRYCGNLLPPVPSPLSTEVARLATAAAEEFGLTGLNGIDFIASGDRVYPIEVNPRWCSSMELVEMADDVDLFRLQVDACVNEMLPASRKRTCQSFGKAIVFARDEVVIGDTRGWLDDPAVRDVPHPGETIARGRPVCTVFARAETAGACRAALERTAERVYEELARWNIVFSSGTQALHHERGPDDEAGPADQRRQRQP
jgi:hypothetical protein